MKKILYSLAALLTIASFSPCSAQPAANGLDKSFFDLLKKK